jgi:hypothetical protein
MVLYSCLLIVFSLHRESVKLILVDGPLPEVVLSHLSPPCEMCGSLKGKPFHATTENTEAKKEVAYLTSHLERMVVSEKMIEDDLSQVEESAIKSTYKLGIGFEMF